MFWWIISSVAKYVFEQKIMKNSRVKDLEAGCQTEAQAAAALAEAIEAEKKRLDKFKKSSAHCFIAGNVFALIFMALVLSDWIDFSKVIKTTAEELSDIQSRIGFVMRYSTAGAMWVLRCLFTIMLKRARSPAIDPTSGCEAWVQTEKNIFNNSIEQFVLALVSNLIFIQHLDGERTLKYIPALVFLFMLGRFTFWLGYPKYSLFGFSLNILALSVIMGYNLFKSYEALI